MNVYDAIMMAAEHIEGNPAQFNYMAVGVPAGRHCGSPGCAIGWLAHFLGYDETTCGVTCGLTDDILGIDYDERTRRMDSVGVLFWRVTAAECARAFRLYAEKYHHADKVAAPDWNAIAAKRTVADDARSEEVHA